MNKHSPFEIKTSSLLLLRSGQKTMKVNWGALVVTRSWLATCSTWMILSQHNHACILLEGNIVERLILLFSGGMLQMSPVTIRRDCQLLSSIVWHSHYKAKTWIFTFSMQVRYSKLRETYCRLSKLLKPKVKVFSTIQTLALIFSSQIKSIPLRTNDKIFTTMPWFIATSLFLLLSSRSRPTCNLRALISWFTSKQRYRYIRV